jgi:integrase/recombinase XerD
LFDYIWQYPEPREMMLRNYLFMKLAYTSWMRLSELLAIRYEDILKPGDEITIVGKGDKIRPIYFTQEIKNLTEEYVSYRTKRPPTSLWSGHTRKLQWTGELLFIRHDDYGFGKWLSKSTIAWMFKKYSEGLGLGKKITCHMLRHSYGTTLMRKGVNIRLVQELLGHSSIMSTQRYTHVTNRDMLMAHQTVFF